MDIEQSWVRRTGTYNTHTNIRADTTTFFLGVESVHAINDGGFGIRYNIGGGPTYFRPTGVRPVLSLEVLSLEYFPR